MYYGGSMGNPERAKVDFEEKLEQTLSEQSYTIANMAS